MADKQRQIVIHSDYANGDTEGPYRDARTGDTLVSPDKVRVYDGVLADGYLELSHDGVQAKVESSLGAVNVDGVVVAAHAGRHLGGGADSIKLDELAAPTDITTLNADLTKHGLLPKLGGGTTNFLRADGTWAAPSGSSVLVKTAFTEITVDTTTTSTSFVNLLSIAITTGAGWLVIRAAASGDASGGLRVMFRILVDGVTQRGAAYYPTAVQRTASMALQLRVPVTAGAHTVVLQWKVSSGTGYIRPVLNPDRDSASLLVSEVTA